MDNRNDQFTSMDRAYPFICDALQLHGAPFWPRGKECREFRPGCFSLPISQGMLRSKTRRLNYAFWVAETLGYMSPGFSAYELTQLLVKLNSKYAEFVDANTEQLWPMVRYGDWLPSEMKTCFKTLSEDPSSRQAVAYIGRPGLQHSYMFAPCTESLQFFAEHKGGGLQLSMIATMRSNDANWGLPYDVAAFCAIGTVMAECLGWATGTYNHHAGSLHYYVETPPRWAWNLEDEFNDLMIPTGWIGKLSDFQFDATAFLMQLHQQIVLDKVSVSQFEFYSNNVRKSYWEKWASIFRYGRG